MIICILVLQRGVGGGGGGGGGGGEGEGRPGGGGKEKRGTTERWEGWKREEVKEESRVGGEGKRS